MTREPVERLPTRTGSSLHRVKARVRIDRGGYDYVRHLAYCSQERREVRLVSLVPRSPGDGLDRYSDAESPDAGGVWTAVGEALLTFHALRQRAATTEESTAYDAVAELMRELPDVTMIMHYSNYLPGTAARWRRMPEEHRYLLPGLIIAGANGLERCCRRCENLAIEA